MERGKGAYPLVGQYRFIINKTCVGKTTKMMYFFASDLRAIYDTRLQKSVIQQWAEHLSIKNQSVTSIRIVTKFFEQVKRGQGSTPFIEKHEPMKIANHSSQNWRRVLPPTNTSLV